MNISSATKTAALSALLALAAAGAMAGWQSGTALPNLSEFGLEGELPALSGKVVLIDFWASWCQPCKASFPALEKLRAELADKDVVVLAVNLDEKEQAMRKFLKTNPVTFPVVRDAQQKLVKAAEPQSMPSSFIVDRKGVIRFVHAGFHGEKTIKQYSEEIAALLKETP